MPDAAAARLFPFLLAEFLTGARLLNTLFGAVFSTPEVLPHTRLGFTRAVGPFAHPIQMGLIASVGFANVYFVLWRRREVVRLVAAGFVFATTMLAISSGPLFSLVLQAVMMLWERILAFLRSRWILAVVIGGGGFAVLLASVQGGVFTYVVENLVFSTGAGEHRLDIYGYGTRAVLQHPLFGVGHGEWARPFWREHPTIDSFWLMTAVRHGIPLILLLMFGLLARHAADRHRRGARGGAATARAT